MIVPVLLCALLELSPEVLAHTGVAYRANRLSRHGGRGLALAALDIDQSELTALAKNASGTEKVPQTSADKDKGASDDSKNKAAGPNSTPASAKGDGGPKNKTDASNASVMDMFFRNPNQLGTLKNTTAADVMKVKQNGAEDLEALISALIFNSCAVVICFIGFAVLRSFFPLVYSHRTESASEGYVVDLPVPALKLFGWFFADTSDEQVVDAAGLDGLMFVEYHRLCRRILGTVGPLIMLTLAPAHYFFGHMKEVDPLSSIGVATILHGSDQPLSGNVLGKWSVPAVCWGQAIGVWFVMVCTLQYIFSAQKRFLDHRFKWLMEIPLPRATTILVEAIPQEYCSDEALRAYFVKLFSEDAVAEAYVVRKTRQLRKLYKEWRDVEQLLSQANAQWEASGQDPDQRPRTTGVYCVSRDEDAINAYERRVAQSKTAVDQERKRIEDLVPSCSSSVCSRSGFVTFSTRRWCRLASREQLCSDAGQFVCNMPPDPEDVIYEDLAKDPALQKTNAWIAGALTFGIFCVWMPIITFLGTFTNLTKLQEIFPGLKPVLADRPALCATLEGVLATIALKVFMSLLPTILMAIVVNFYSLKAGTWAQLELQSRYFAFQIIFVLLVTAVGQALFETIEQLILQPTHIFQLLAQHLPQSSHFYMNYLVLGWFALAMALLRVSPLMKFIFFKNARGVTPEQARQQAEPEDQDSDGAGSRFAKAATMMTITLVFCTCSPLIGLFGWVYFLLGEGVYRYLIVYAETRKPDLGGAFWVMALRHLYVALALFIIMMSGILMRAGNKEASFFAGSALVYLVGSYLNFGNLRWQTLPFEAIAEADHKAKRERLESEDLSAVKTAQYVQEECIEGGGRRGSIPRLSLGAGAQMSLDAGGQKRDDGGDAPAGRGARLSLR